MAEKVLIVDDDILLHRLMRHQLEREGFTPLHALNGRDALETAFQHLPDLIVVDVMMEDMDGLSVMRELRRNLLTRSTPVIVITASTLPIARQESKNLGAREFMNKPFGPAQLIAAIRRVLPQGDPPVPTVLVN